MTIKKVAITGIAGSLGTVLCKRLHERNIQVFGLARSGDPIERIQKYTSRLIVGSVDNASDVHEFLQGADAIVNCAGLLPASLALGEEQFFRVNVKGAELVLKQARENSIKKAVFLSTIGVLDHSYPTSKEDIFRYRTERLDHYTRSKIALEKMLLQESSSDNLDITILRPSFLIGETFVSIWSEVLETVKKGKMCLLGSGNGLFPLVHGNDVADYIIDILEQPIKLGPAKIAYVSDPFPVTARKLFDLFAAYFGVPKPRCIPTPIAYAAAKVVELIPKPFRFGRLKLLTGRRVREYSAGYNLSHILGSDNFGFKPKMQIEQGLISMLSAYEKER